MLPENPRTRPPNQDHQRLGRHAAVEPSIGRFGRVEDEARPKEAGGVKCFIAKRHFAPEHDQAL